MAQGGQPVEGRGDGLLPQAQTPEVGWNFHTVSRVLKETASDRVVRMVVGAILLTGVTYGIGAAVKEYADYESMWNALASTAAVAAISSGLTTAFLISVLMKTRHTLEKMNAEQRGKLQQQSAALAKLAPTAPVQQAAPVQAGPAERKLYYEEDVKQLIAAGAMVMEWDFDAKAYRQVAKTYDYLSDDGKNHDYVLMFPSELLIVNNSARKIAERLGVSRKAATYGHPPKKGEFFRLLVREVQREGQLPSEFILDVRNRTDRRP